MIESSDLLRLGTPIAVARAPGRLDVMGGIADYSGSLVLELPLGVATTAAAQRSDDARVTVRTDAVPAPGDEREVSVAIDALFPRGVPLDYDAARALLGADRSRAWAGYVAGALVVLGRERRLVPAHGVRVVVDSTVPPGKGVSSSAALEVASMQAIAAVYGVALEGRELALLCQRVENRVVGAPCGVMDQMTAALGEQDRLLAILCQPAEPRGQVAIPPGLELWGIDSGIRHEVSGADYGAVRVGAFMGYRVLADLAGLRAEPAGDGKVRVNDPRWGGWLANVSPAEWARFASDVPERMRGADFLAHYGGTTDDVTRVDAAREYAVRQPTAHPILEHDRVRRFRSILDAGAEREENRHALGVLMLESHASYGACGLGSTGTDRLVELVRERGEGALYGAKITGGGSGGVVAVLARRGSLPVIQKIARAYQDETGREATIIGGSSDGAVRTGVRWR